MGEVVKPRAFTYNGTFHQWLARGVSANRTLPTICIHICSVARVSFHSASGNDGQASGESGTTFVRESVMTCRLGVNSIAVDTTPGPATRQHRYSISRTGFGNPPNAETMTTARPAATNIHWALQ